MPFPELGPALPRMHSRWSRWLGRLVVRGMGWAFEGTLPNVPRLILIGAPHTSNWDFVVGMAMRLALGLDVRWIGKHTIFRPPFGWLMRWLGGIPVDRSSRQGAVAQVVARFAQEDQFMVGISPEGTRRRVAQWKTGFYHMAVGAGVPILPLYFDYPRRRIGVGPLLHPSGDLDADLLVLRRFYTGYTGKHPHLYDAGLPAAS